VLGFPHKSATEGTMPDKGKSKSGGSVKKKKSAKKK
jgi:hypothetical protein